MMFGGGARTALRDVRTDEERLHDAQLWMGSNGLPSEPEATPVLASPRGMPGIFGKSALPALQDKTSGGATTAFTPSDSALRLAALGGGEDQVPARQQQPLLDGAWSNFDPSTSMDLPATSRFVQANAVLQGKAPQTGTKPQRAPWEVSRGRNFWGTLLETLGTSLMASQAFNNGDYGAGSTMLRQMQQDQEERRRRQQLGQALRGRGYSDDDIMIAMNDPQSLSRNYNERFGTRVVAPGSSIVQGGPSGQQQTYTQPGQAEQYASALGYRPGTPDYRTAAQDYVLRSSGPTAYGYDVGLDDERTENDLSLERARQAGRTALEAQRQSGRVGLEGARQRNRMTTRGSPTYRDLNPPAPRTSRSGGGGAPSAAQQGPTATGPNGQKLRWNGSAWVPAS